jgi:hypothetical protein
MTDSLTSIESSLTLGLICTSLLLFISEILPYLPVKAKGVVQGIEIATTNTLKTLTSPTVQPLKV